MKTQTILARLTLLGWLASTVIAETNATIHVVPVDHTIVPPVTTYVPADAVTTNGPASAATDIAWETPLQAFHANHLKGKLEIGTRSTSYDFDQTQKGDRATRAGTYFGTINKLKPEDDSSPTRLYIQYAFVEYLGIGVTWDDVKLATKDGPTPEETDGNVTVDSTYLYLFGRYPNKTHLVPFAEVGMGLHDIGFDADPNWARRNSLTLSDEDALFYSLGLEYWFTPNLSVNILQRQTSFTTTGEWKNIDGRKPSPVEMKLDHTVTGFGVKYTF
jgi:outer membrane protein W